MSEKDKTFRAFMRELRVKAGLTTEEAARRIGVGVTTIDDWENGVSFPSELSAQRISSVYQVSQEEWLEVLKKHLNFIFNSSGEG